MRSDPCIDCNRLAAALYRRAVEQVQAQQEPEPAQSQPAAWEHAQAPSSVTLKWQVGGIELLLTLRDATDDALFARIRRVLPKIEAKMDAQRQTQMSAQANGQPISEDRKIGARCTRCR